MFLNFYRAVWNERSSDENSVDPYVCQTQELWQTEEKLVQIFIPYQRPFSLVFWQKRMVGWGRSRLAEIVSQSDRVGAKSPILNRYLLVAPQL